MKCAFAVNQELLNEMREKGITYSEIGCKIGLSSREVKEVFRNSNSSVQIAMIEQALQDIEVERKEMQSIETH